MTPPQRAAGTRQRVADQVRAVETMVASLGATAMQSASTDIGEGVRRFETEILLPAGMLYDDFFISLGAGVRGWIWLTEPTPENTPFGIEIAGGGRVGHRRVPRRADGPLAGRGARVARPRLRGRRRRLSAPHRARRDHPRPDRRERPRGRGQPLRPLHLGVRRSLPRLRGWVAGTGGSADMCCPDSAPPNLCPEQGVCSTHAGTFERRCASGWVRTDC